MQDKGNIEELFKSAFDQFEEPVRPELWSQISGKMNPATPPTDVATVAKQASGISKIISGGGLWIAGAAIVVTTAAVYYLKPSVQQEPSNANAQVEKIASTVQNSDAVHEITASAGIAETPIQQPAAQQHGGKVNVNSSSIATSTQEPATAQPSSTPENQQSNTPGNNTEIVEHTRTTSPVSNNNGVSGTQTAGVAEGSNEMSGTTDLQVPVLQVFPLTGTAPLTVSCLFSGSAESASWNLGDGTIIDNQKPFNHTFTAPGVYQLTLTTTDQSGKKHHAFTEIVVKSDNLLSNIPNIFTPNGDGRNDIFIIESDKVVDFEATIIDKSGKTIYSWKGIDNGWDGKLSSGADAEKGTYFYVIFATASDKIKHTYKGTLTLIR